MAETEKKKGCWVFFKVPSGTPVVEEDFHLTAPDGTVHRPDICGTLVDAHVVDAHGDCQDVEIEIQVPGEPVTRKVHAPNDIKTRALLQTVEAWRRA